MWGWLFVQKFLWTIRNYYSFKFTRIWENNSLPAFSMTSQASTRDAFSIWKESLLQQQLSIPAVSQMSFPGGFFNTHLSNLEMHIIFPEDEDHVLKCEWESIFGSVSAFWRIFLLLNFYDHSNQCLLEKVKHSPSFFQGLCGLFWPLYIAFPLLKCPWQSTNSFVSRTHLKP